MKRATWRSVLLICCAAGALLVAVGFFDQVGLGGSPPWYGVMGAYVSGSSQPYHLSFRGIDRGGPADRAGIHDGDTVDVREQTPTIRLALLGQPMAGRPMTVQLHRAGGTSQAAIVPARFVLARYWNYTVWQLASLWLLLFAVLIAWRRPYVDNNLLLATMLACSAIGLSSLTLFFAWPSLWGYVTIALIGQTSPLAIALWAALASAFARPLSRARRLAMVLCYALVAASIVVGSGTPDFTLGLAPLLGTLTLWFDPTIFIGPAWTVVEIAAAFAAAVCSVLAVLATSRAERQRAPWLLMPCIVFFCMETLDVVAFHFLSYETVLRMGYFFSITAIVTPMILTYAALNRRLIDVGFVLNRTVVFAVVSTIVIGAFVLVEWAAGEWLVNESHTTSVLVGMVVALALGFSLRPIHHYVDRFVDHMLFRKRHHDETALRRFAHEASYINDRSALIERALHAVRNHTTAESADILITNGARSYQSTSNPDTGAISEDDPVIVALTAWNERVDLHGLSGSRVQGELAFPMASRGRLLGVLVCGPKRDGEAYAPDETEALAAMGRGIGVALDVIEAREERSSEPLTDLAASIRELSEITRGLPDALAERLRRETRRPAQ
jgi:hypothetical protein